MHPGSPFITRTLTVLAPGLVALLLLGIGCGRSIPEGSLVLTQVPLTATTANAPGDWMDERYPAGSRVVLVTRPEHPQRVRVLSRDLVAAGCPALSPCGEWVLFSAKAQGASTWQIYETRLKAGSPRRLTSMPGGAMDPVYLPDGRFVFSSPVPAAGEFRGGHSVPELYAQPLAGGEAARLTFGLAGAMSPTVLGDGRILFTSGGSAVATVTNLSLFTINNDGTELTGYAGQHDGVAQIWHPRELPDRRVVFLSTDWGVAPVEGRVEQVLSARPYSSRTTAFTHGFGSVRSIEPGINGELWIAARHSDPGQEGRFALFQVNNAVDGPGDPWFDDPAWHDVEAVAVTRRAVPMGRLSTVKPAETTGMFLCLDANDSSYVDQDGAVPEATHVRLLIGEEDLTTRPLGVVPVLADGSFLVEVPADRPIGFEALDDEGRVLRRLAPTVWVRPGENRACVGCHEPHNTAPDNRRPLAVKERVVPLADLLESISMPGVQP
jgi:hypothetical protein